MANSNEIKSDYIFFTENSIDEDTRNSVVTNLGANECVQVVYGNSIGISTDTDSIHLEICKITYNKRVYYPGEVHITMTVISTDNQQVKNIGSLQNSAKTIFLQKRISLVGTQNNNNLVYIAKHYYVQSLSFSVGETQTNVVVHAFSPDKKLTFDKYCNAYTSKKLGEDILKEELLGEKGIFKKCDIPFTYNLDNLQRLKINEVELCQPYLIQHNESFHDFVCRVANRCGECFYYEDDTLFLGLPSLTPKGLNDISVIYECPEIDDGGSVISTTDFYSDYTKDEADPAEKSNYYNDEIGADEYFREITDDDQIGYLDIFGLWALFSAMASGLEGEDYTDLISKMVKDAGSNAANAGIVQRAVNDDFKTDYIDKEPDFTKVEDKVIDMLSTVYRKHTKEEEKATRNVTKLDFQAQLSPLMLGDIIKIGEMKHVVTSLQGHYDSTSGTTTYHHQAEAIPFATDEKPIPPVGRVPHILKASPQEAIVAKTDDPLCLGRVRITYLWQQSKVTVKTKGDDGKEVEDTQDLSPAQSPWIRIAVPFAGGLGGMVMTPEKDSHVMVNYIMGNIERPYVDGALYYKGQEPPTGYVELLNKYFQPSTNRRVISSSSGHSITFLDGKGASSFVSGLIPPLGQIWSLTKGCMALEDKKKIRNGEIDEARKTDTDDREFVGGIVLRDSNDIYNISMSTQGRSISISSPFGKVDINAFTGITINAPNGDVKIKGKNISLEAGNNISIVAGKNIRPKDPSSGEIVGGILGSIAGGIAAQIATQQAKNFLTFDPTKLSDLSFLRSLWEVLMRPVEGTLSIKSNRNVTMTAGKGKAMIPTSLMSNYASKGWKNHMNKDEKAAKDLGSTIEGVLIEATRVINTFYEEIQFSEETIRKLSNEFHTHLSFFNSEENKLNDTSQSTIQTLKTKSSEELLNYITDNLCPQLQPADGKENNIEITESLRKFKNNFDTLKRHLDYINEHTKDELLKKINQQLEREKKLQGSNNWPLFVATFNSKEGREQILGSSILSDKKGMKRTVFVAILDIYNDQITHPIIGDVANDEQWNDLINGIEFKNDPKDKEGGVLNSFATALGAELLPVITSGAVTVEDDNVKVFDSGQKLFNRNGCAGPRVLWDVASNGNILVSNSAQHTYQLNLASNGWEPVLNAGLNGLKDYLKKS